MKFIFIHHSIYLITQRQQNYGVSLHHTFPLMLQIFKGIATPQVIGNLIITISVSTKFGTDSDVNLGATCILTTIIRTVGITCMHDHPHPSIATFIINMHGYVIVLMEIAHESTRIGKM